VLLEPSGLRKLDYIEREIKARQWAEELERKLGK
jgi:hypothetical protein